MRRIVIAALISTSVVFASLVTVALAVCVPTAYTVTSSAPPASATWTDTSGLWTPAGGFPGCAPGDSASDTNASPTTIIINSSIPNPIIGLNLACNGCLIDIQPGGHLTLAGSGSIGNGATLRVSGGSLAIASGGNLTFQSGSSFQINNGLLDIQTGGQITVPDSVTTTVSGGLVQLSGGTLTIPPAATLAIQNGAQLELDAGTVNGGGAINNSGLVQASPATAVSVNDTVNNLPGGSVSVLSGVLSIRSGGSGNAPFNITAGATLDFPTGSYTMTPNGVVSGGGTLKIDGGTLSIGGVTSPGAFAMSSGTLTGAGFLSVNSNFDWSGGTITGTGGTQITGTGVGTFSGANGDMTLDGRAFDDYGYVHYTATTNALYVSNTAMLSVYGTFSIENDGSIHAGGATPTINVSPNGVFQKTGGTGVSNIEPDFNNNATVWGFMGTLNIIGNGTDNGSFGAFSPGTIQFSATSTTLTNNSQVFGTGKVAFRIGAATIGGFFGMDGLTAIGNANVQVNSSATTNMFTFAGTGILTVNNAFTLTNSGTFSGGTLAGTTGSFFVQNGATLTIDAVGGFPIILDGEIFNDGTLIYNSTTNPLELDNGGDIYNNTGLFDIQTDVKIIARTGVIIASVKRKVATSAPAHRQHRRVAENAITALCGCSPAVFNLGTLKKSAGAGTIDFQPELDTSGTFNLLSGTMQFDAAGVFQAGGTTTLGPGNISMIGSPYTLTSGTFQGAGTLTGDLKNAGGDVAPGGSAAIGTINVTGNYTQGSAASMTIELASPSSYDILAAGGNTTLDGTLTVSLISPYQPANGATFQPHTFAARTGDFATKNFPTWAAGHGSFSQTYTPTALVLTAVVTPQSADLAAGMTGPATVNAAQPLSYGITITNNGPDPTSGTITVVDTLPTGATGASGSGTGWSCGAPSGGKITCTSTTSLAATAQLPTLTIAMTAPVNGGGVTNSATVSVTSSNDPNPGNNTASVNTTVVAGATGTDVSVNKYGPANAGTGGLVDFVIDVFNNGPALAANVILTDPTPSGLTFVSSSGACTTPFPCPLGSLPAGSTRTVISRYFVTAPSGSTITNTANVSTTTTDTNSANNSSQASVRIVPCPTTPPQIVTPANGAITSSPVNLSWSTVTGASYIVTITGTTSTTLPVTAETSVDVVLPVGGYSWTVRANFATGCPSLTSTASAFTVCIVPDAPLASVVGELTTGQTFRVEWAPVGNATAYELQEASDAAFTNPTIFAVNGTSRDFTKVATNATAFFYRVRALSTCGQSPFSPTISVVVIPVPKPTDPRFNVIVPNGSVTPVVFQIFIPGLPSGPVSFIATADRPWLAVVPQAGIVPPEGTLLTISVDPGTLVNGTWTGTILIVYNIPASGKTAPNASQTTSIPVSISLVTPITPGKLPGPTANTLIIPTVGHLFGVDSQWQSDIRIANLTSSKATYLVSFNSGSGNPSVPAKQTTLTIDPGATTALDDIVRQWFGVGSLGDSANGILYVQALDAAGRPLSGSVPNDVSINKTVAVSSRTYNTTANATSPGTLGQFVPATAFANFIGRAGGGAVSSIVSLQQIAQTDAFRTNLGLVEAAGKAISLKVGVFDATGSKLLDLPFSLAAGQQLQLNAFLAQNNISVTNGRLQVEVTSGDGRVQSYASVIDTKTGDPFLVSGTLLGGTASNYVVPGVGDLNTGNASWRTDVRIFNAGAAPQTTTLTYYPNGNPSDSISKSVAINPGEVKALDGVVQSLFGLSNTSGALHVTTPTESPLVITARTFDQTPSGTLGQFIPAVTNNDVVGRNDRSLQVLQAEESVHYRTNLGIAEVTGNAVTVEVSVFLPDSKVIPHVTLSLAANESRQIPILSSLGIGATYNARLAVRVTDGDGKVTAYGSVVDMVTQAPTFIPAQ